MHIITFLVVTVYINPSFMTGESIWLSEVLSCFFQMIFVPAISPLPSGLTASKSVYVLPSAATLNPVYQNNTPFSVKGIAIVVSAPSTTLHISLPVLGSNAWQMAEPLEISISRPFTLIIIGVIYA